ncbi:MULTISPECIES: sugar 3,4-ketoisomerase [Bacillaceae]|uniref:sugar 3,4-ketoisomerase n=1 Tax=Bacillaceae TaxID=186817 RepID=UPI000BFD2105|nr:MULTISPECIES: FdtA/QdtA family cupin domain-containing protein [Bacillaceae]PGT82989.1 dTDP-6-deoxy-3,4-keto-hexulose isomerase [Bacillus sp. AFS040349]UGB29489.1 FdtA/QdtA family cupin domain-containing protein [Metabacillus sp. B2-18]
MDNCLINFTVIGDNRGSLISLEALKNIPFEIKRVYYIYNTINDLPRGFHAHRELKQVLICTSGSCRVVLDNGETKMEHLLNKSSQGLIVNKMVWREMYDFSEDCVLMVLASDYYDEADYIRDYGVFLQMIENTHKVFEG